MERFLSVFSFALVCLLPLQRAAWAADLDSATIDRDYSLFQDSCDALRLTLAVDEIEPTTIDPVNPDEDKDNHKNPRGVLIQQFLALCDAEMFDQER